MSTNSWSALPVTPSMIALISSTSIGGAATEALTVTGLLASDTILSVTQQTSGAAVLPLLGWSNQINNSLTGIWSADPGAGAILIVTVKR